MDNPVATPRGGGSIPRSRAPKHMMQLPNYNSKARATSHREGRKKKGSGRGGGGCSAAVKRGAAFLSATELIRSLSFNSKWKYGVGPYGGRRWGFNTKHQSTKVCSLLWNLDWRQQRILHVVLFGLWPQDPQDAASNLGDLRMQKRKTLASVQGRVATPPGPFWGDSLSV